MSAARSDRGPLEFDGRRATVMGLGLFGGGAAAARFLAARGARVTVTDLRGEDVLAPALSELPPGVRVVLGEHRAEDFTGADLVVANPAVPPAHPLLAAARAAGAEVTSEIALFLQRCPARVAAVTGTQGKSSTVTMLHQLLLAAGLRAHLGGNIGRSLLESAYELSEDDVVVLELSSYQLEALPRPFSPRARVEAVCATNVLADHLDRHKTIPAYSAAKERILELARPHEGVAVLPAEDARIASWDASGVRVLEAWTGRASDRGLNLRGGSFRLHRDELGATADLRLPGKFQHVNALYALGLARAMGAEAAPLAAAIGTLRGPPHRLEDLGSVRGHRVWDNGVATTPDATLGVLDSLEPGIALLAGGRHKGLDLAELARAAHGRVRRAVCYGEAREVLRAAFAAAGVEARAVPDLDAAVGEAFAWMGPGEALLFSPSCSSFDGYANFKERALAFRRALEREGSAGVPAAPRRGAAEGL